MLHDPKSMFDATILDGGAWAESACYFDVPSVGAAVAAWKNRLGSSGDLYYTYTIVVVVDK